MQIFMSLSATKYNYGLRLRPLGADNVPANYVEYLNLTKSRAVTDADELDYIYGIVVYDRPLTFAEIERYNLTDLNTTSETNIWNSFLNFVRMIRRESPTLTLDQFIKGYIVADGTYAKQNPLYKWVKPDTTSVYNYMRKFTTYSANYKGLTELWQNMGKR